MYISRTLIKYIGLIAKIKAYYKTRKFNKYANVGRNCIIEGGGEYSK